MKIVQLYDSYVTKGGVERVLALLLNGWTEQGHETSLLVREGQVSDVYPLDDRVQRFSLQHALQPQRMQRLVNYARDIPALRRHAAIRQADILIANGPWCALLAVLALKVIPSRQPTPSLIVCDHNNPAAFGKLTQAAGRLLYRHADCILSLTQTQAMQYQAISQRITVIPNPVSLPAPSPASCIPDNQVLAVGRLAHQKGFDDLLKAWAQVIAQRPDAHLTIIGEGPDQAALQTQAQSLSLTQHVSWLPFTDRIFEHYQQSSLLAVSSRYEGQGLVLLEAQTYGLPIVSFDCDFGPREVINNHLDGILCEPANPDALAAALLDLLNDPARCAAMRHNAKKAAEKYALPDVLAKWNQLFQQLTRPPKMRST